MKKGTKATAGVCFCPFAVTVLVGCRLRVWATALPCPNAPTQLCEKELQIVGVGYKAQLTGKKLVLNLGFSHTIEFNVPEGVKVTVDGAKITVEGADKQAVGEAAAEIRRFRPPEPYKGKGIRYADERIILKEGKSVG